MLTIKISFIKDLKLSNLTIFNKSQLYKVEGEDDETYYVEIDKFISELLEDTCLGNNQNIKIDDKDAFLNSRKYGISKALKNKYFTIVQEG